MKTYWLLESEKYKIHQTFDNSLFNDHHEFWPVSLSFTLFFQLKLTKKEQLSSNSKKLFHRQKQKNKSHGKV